MSARKRFLLAALPVALAPVLIWAAPGEIKLATLAPANTSWHKALLDMGNTWNKDTAGRVTLTVYPGGMQGDESTTVKKMRPGIDTLQASFLTAAGLAELDEAFNVFDHAVLLRVRRRGNRRGEEADTRLRAEAAGQGLPPSGLGHRRLGAGLLEEAACARSPT